MGTKNDPLERPLVERERDARARDRIEKFLAEFRKRYPTAIADDQQRTAYAAAALSEMERAEALDKLDAFLASLRALKRKAIPAGWRYLEEKRWTLLGAGEAAKSQPAHPLDSAEGKAIVRAYEIAGCDHALRTAMIRQGLVYYYRPMTPRLLKLAEAPPGREAWAALTRQQAGAWEAFLREVITVQTRNRLHEGSLAPWPWPPGVDGRIYTATGPPQPEISDQDAADFR